MSIVSAALLPHSPLLIPAIGKDAHSLLQKTSSSFLQIKNDLLKKNVDTVILLATSDVHRRHSKFFRIHLPSHYSAEFSTFGDLITQTEFQSNTVLGTEIKNELLRANFTITYKSQTLLDYTAGVPLTLLCAGTSMKVIVIEPAEVNSEVLFEFGRTVSSVLQQSSKNSACIASGDLARCMNKKKHEHYSENCLPFNYLFLDAIQKKDPKALIDIDSASAEKMGVCALPVARVLRGIVDSSNWTSRVLSYEAPFDVGYAALEFIL